MRKLSLYVGLYFLCLLVLSGCGKLERKGTASTNALPQVYFTNIPPESTYFSVNPRIYWFGTDIDGFIAAYQYAVMVRDSVLKRGGLDQVKSDLHAIPTDSVSWVDQTSLKNMIGVHVQAEPGGHSRNVGMYADMDPEIYTPQYVFVRAVDNRGDVSEEVIHRMFSRNNHRPSASIVADSAIRVKNHYCLEETTATWKGISITWEGLDSLDYPDKRDQPEFEFKWELVGPFADSLDSPFEPETTASFVADSSLDSILIAGEWIPSRWVSEKTHVFKGLENSGDLGYGWYQLRVRARDDAFVSHDTVAWVNFRILKPKFRYADKLDSTILIVDASTYGGKDGGANHTEDVRPFYEKVLEDLFQAGLCDKFELWYDPDKLPNEIPKNAPGEDVLSRYDLTIVLNLGSNPGISGDNYKVYKEYLNIGGRLWLIGLNNFGLLPGKDTPQPVSDFATQYFGIEEMFAPSWTPTDSMTLEFIQAKPFGLWGELPRLVADTVECKNLKGYDPNWRNDNFRYFGVRGIPYVCYVAMSNNVDFKHRIPAERRIFTFISYYPISPMHNRPCAVNYIGPTYRTAEFCFPLNLMKNDEQDDYPAFKVMEKMVQWFWEDLP